MELVYRIVERIGRLDRIGAVLTRLGLVIVTLWIGGLKVTHYEAEGIAPFVANSPLMSWLYNSPRDYERHRTAEGAVNAANASWHQVNGTYSDSLLIGLMIVAIGATIAFGFRYPLAGVVGGILLVGMSVVTLSFLITTPEAWVPAHGASAYGFPFLAAPGRLVIKDAIMLGASLWSAADSAKRFLAQRNDDRHVTRGDQRPQDRKVRNPVS
jgi:reactive chlorine resistance protein C